MTADDGLQFLNDAEARTVEAIAERLIPADQLGPGAAEAGVVTYIDRALAGFSRVLQPVYRLGLRELDRWCRGRYGDPFVELDDVRRDAVLVAWFGPPEPAGDEDTRDDLWSPGELAGSDDLPESSRISRLLAVVREHTVEGFFCDPAYGGNREAVGWRLVNFPGAQWGYTAEQMRPGFDASVLPIVTLADLRRGLADVPDSDVFYGGDTR
jgi:gluconate 2-dehydrogenase gamma chain